MKTMSISRKLVLLARFMAARIGPGATTTTPFEHSGNVTVAKQQAEAAVKTLARLEKLGPKLASMAAGNPNAQQKLVQLFHDAYTAATYTGSRHTDLASHLAKYYRTMTDGGKVSFYEEAGHDRTPVILRQLMALEKKYRGKIYFGSSPVRITIILEGVVAEYKRKKKVVGKLAFHPIHLHYFPGSTPVNSFVAQTLLPGTGPNYAAMEAESKWSSDAMVASTVGTHGREEEVGEIGLVASNTPRSSHINQPHPHIYGNGLVCQGDGLTFVGMALAEGRIFDAFEVVLQVLAEPKGVEDGCQNYHNILYYPHCEVPCLVCEKMCDTENPKAAHTNRAVHEGCVKHRCPDTGFPADEGDEKRVIDGVGYHTSAITMCPETSKYFRNKMGVTSTLSQQLIHPARAGVCAISGVSGRIRIHPGHAQLADDLIPWGDKHDKYVSVFAVDMAANPSTKENGNGEEETALPISTQDQWWFRASGAAFSQHKYGGPAFTEYYRSWNYGTATAQTGG